MNEDKLPLPVSETPPTGGPQAAAASGAEGAKAVPIPVPQARYPKRRASARDLILAGLLLACGFLFWDSVMWARGLGLGEAIALGAVLPAALWYLRGRGGRMGCYGWVCVGLFLLGAASLALSGDAELKWYTLPVLSILFLIVVLEKAGLRTGTGLRARLHDITAVGFSLGFSRMDVGAWAVAHPGSEDSARSKRNRAVLIGLCCAIPVLAVLLPLLVSSDAAFEGMVRQVDREAILRFLLALAFGGSLALRLFSLLFTTDRGPRALSSPGASVEPAAIAAFLAAVSVAYVLYLFSQFAYFTDAFRGLLPASFSVAEYARRGFFEMCVIVGINLALVVLARGLCRKAAGRLPGAVRALALFLCLFSLVLAAAAVAKLFLYMHSFGLTRLRVLTAAFTVLLALIVLAEAVRLFLPRLPVPQIAVALGAAALIGLSLVNVDARVARYNVGAWRSGGLPSLDMDTICELGPGAVPVLAELAGDTDREVAGRAARELGRRTVQADPRSWDLVEAEAAALLTDYR